MNQEVVYMINIIIALVSIVLAIVVLVVGAQMRKHNVRMGWFITMVCICLSGLSYQVAGLGFESSVNIYTVFSNVLYAGVAPVFARYFIETEIEEGQSWDRKFWTVLHALIAVLVIIVSCFGSLGFFEYVPFFIQYFIVMVMLLISSKNIKASAGFIAGICFPLAASLVGMTGMDISIMGFGEVMLLLLVIFLYQIDTERELMNKQVELSENKVSLLMEQMHPHFIYNALQQIALLCDEEPSEVKGAIFNFSGYLRNNLEALTNEKMIPFMKEMEHVDAYIALSQILPSKEFHVEKDFEITDFYVPALVVQPLVENAIKYGIGMSSEGDRIRIQTRVEGGYVVISVVDDGRGKKTELATQKKHKSVGTSNVKMRLKILCDGELEVHQSSDGTEAIVKIPEITAKTGGFDK
ncbi:MAG: histidine kinase [Lachnospiraceae bacterium]|nr:histidine kinase [Lachnospiraceae bacterium]